MYLFELIQLTVNVILYSNFNIKFLWPNWSPVCSYEVHQNARGHCVLLILMWSSLFAVMTTQRSRGCWRGAGQCSGSRWHLVGSVYFCTCGPWWFQCSSQRDSKPRNPSHMIQYHHCPFTTTVLCVCERERVLSFYLFS